MMAPLIFALKRSGVLRCQKIEKIIHLGSGVLRCQKIEKIIHLDRNSISGL